MTKEEFTELVKAYGWVSIDSNNQYMISFSREEKTGRMNYYFTTGTVSIQWPFAEMKKPQWYKKVFDLEKLEEILIDLQNI